MASVPRRLHIAGSASKQSAAERVRYAHELVRGLTRAHVRAGGSVLVQASDEPTAEGSGLAVTWDWAVVDEVDALLESGAIEPRGSTGAVLAVAASQRGLDKIPEARHAQWQRLLAAGAVELDVLPPDWRSGALIRERQVRLGDLLVTVSGGMGVEHLADLYAARAKPIVPLDLALGSSYADSKRGGEWLAREALAQPETFFLLGRQQDRAAALLMAASTRDGSAPVEQVVANAVALIDALRPPQVMYVRLLNETAPQYRDVERYFRDCVDQLVDDLGYVRHEVGTDAAAAAFMNQEIFEQLDRSAVVFVDLTAMRPNCIGEMCFALGRDLRTIVSVRADEVSELPFDFKAIPCFTWAPEMPPAETTAELHDFWVRNVDRPPLVRRRTLLA